jgi:putative nucleotidyltransferase with HDIG domain
VPMFVLLPPGLVPVAAVAGGLLGDAFAAQRWRRMLGTLVVAWSFVPPAILLAVLDPGRGWRDAPVYGLAVALWVVADAVGMYVQQRVVGRNADARVDNVLRMYAIEGPLALLAFLGALESDRFAYAFLAPFGVVFVFRELVRERRHRIDQQAELARAYHGTARLLGDMIEVDDRYTGLHSRGVVEMALAVADALGLEPAERRRTELAALLHDVGKIRTPKAILHKPGPLSPAEWAIVREHPAEGARMLAEVGGYLADIGDLVRHHHERYDGGGYPDGLAGDEIPLGSRIVCACDAFSAMTTDRSYRAALPVSAALAELERGAGTQFDPAVVRALVGVVWAETRVAS